MIWIMNHDVSISGLGKVFKLWLEEKPNQLTSI